MSINYLSLWGQINLSHIIMSGHIYMNQNEHILIGHIPHIQLLISLSLHGGGVDLSGSVSCSLTLGEWGG